MKKRYFTNYFRNNKLINFILFVTLSEMLLNHGTKLDSYHTCIKSLIGQYADPIICLNKIGFINLSAYKNPTVRFDMSLS